MGFLFRGYTACAAIIVSGLAGGAFAEDCDTRLGSDGKPVTVCSDAGQGDMAPQADTPTREEMKQDLGEGWTSEVIGDPPPDCDPAAGTCPEGEGMTYGDDLPPDPDLGVE